jgi:phospholipid-binding lipoprotein MlaA
MKLKVFSCAIFFLYFISPALYSEETISYDPFENLNRKTHYFNKSLDRNVLRPSSGVYGTYVPSLIRIPLANVKSNLSEPKRFLNHILQLRFFDAGTDLSRFLINTTIGLAGILDVATIWEIYPKPTDFDETLAYYSTPLGPFVELPLFGPNSTRSTAGLVADYTLNPARAITTGIDGMALLGLEAANIFQKRFEFGPMIDSTLYDSADSYSASRNMFIQRKKSTDQEGFQTEVFDPYDN